MTNNEFNRNINRLFNKNLSKSLSDEEFAKEFGKLYVEMMNEENNDDYLVNEPQMDKFLDILKFFKDFVNKEHDEKIMPVKLEPREERGDLSVKFRVFHIYGEDIQKFCDVMRGASVFGFDADKDGNIMFDITVPNVFKHK